MLSQESRDFLTNTGTYLTAKGISEKDIESFLEDAELHLTEGEKRGKSVEDIFSDSPKEYANQLVKEIQVDYKTEFRVASYSYYEYIMLLDCSRSFISKFK